MVDKLISASLEDYLEAIYIFHINSRHIRITDIGEFLNVKKPSVVHALKHLSDLGLIRKEKYGEIILTKKGLSKGKKIFTRHTTIKKFLTELLEIDEENANIEACKLEHILSEETFNKINEFISKRNEK
ncbi:MAG: metal-dependent transcriptional regulator [Caldisericia bacterium]|nr:metal-dependent transcriptional regulator [Caldisericia bacterium]